MNVLLGCPLGGSNPSFSTGKAIWRSASQAHRVEVMKQTSSLLPTNCNILWCSALNYRTSKNLQWFGMLHSDIVPEDWWVDALINEAVKYDADMMSAIVPVKDQNGATSTAIAKPDSPYGHFCRLTQSQVRHSNFPDTFGINEAVDALARLPEPFRIPDAPRTALLANTGCFVCRLDRDWCEKVWFEQSDRIEFRNGLWCPLFQSEDFNFSWKIGKQGGKVMATRVLNLVHIGSSEWPSKTVWGQPRDLG